MKKMFAYMKHVSIQTRLQCRLTSQLPYCIVNMTAVNFIIVTCATHTTTYTSCLYHTFATYTWGKRAQ